MSGHKENYHPDDIIEYVENRMICKELKTAKSRRNIVVPKICLDLLNEYKNDQVLNGNNISNEDYIFKTIHTNTVWDPSHLTKEWKVFVDKNELKKITVHDIRHSHATYLLSIGVPIQDVSRRIGHSDVGTTLKVYTHSNLEQDKKITNQLEQNLYNEYNTKDNDFGFDVVASIITGIDFVDKENIYKYVEYLTNESVNENNLDSMRLICKNYILDKNKKLDNINLFINDSTSKEVTDAFFDLFGNNQSNYKFDSILEIEKYQDKSITRKFIK